MAITHQLLPNPRILRNVQILVVDNDRDSRDMYAFLLGSYGAKVTAIGSIKDALNLLNGYIPAILICEITFLGESIYPLLQQVRSLAHSSNRTIPILVTSTCPLTLLAQQLRVNVEAYLLKPINIDQLVYQVWSLTHSFSIVYSPRMQNCPPKQAIGKTLCCIAGEN